MPSLQSPAPALQRLRRGLFLLLLCGSLSSLTAQDTPPKPQSYFTDKAGVVDAGTAAALNRQLAEFERITSNQILVFVSNSLPEGAEMAQFATETHHSWGVGQKGIDNGAILFVFVKDRKMFISTGRGLEGALPDATCKSIITSAITPHFRRGDYPGGIQAGVNSMLAATRGEYKGTGRTNAENKKQQNDNLQSWVVALLFLGFILYSFLSRLRSYGGSPVIYTSSGSSTWNDGGGGFSGGGGGSDSFSGGGGDSGGGGAGGSW